jgi:hypothetical protein
VLLSVAQEAAFAYALVAHICQFVPITLVGLFFALRKLFQHEVKVARTANQAQVKINLGRKSLSFVLSAGHCGPKP